MQQTIKHINTFKLSTNKTIAIIVWLVSAFLTAITLEQLGVQQPTNFIAGAILQLGLTRAESPIFRRKGFPAIGMVALVIDVGVNAGGIWPYAKGLGNTDFWRMLQDITNQPNIPPTTITLLVFVLTLGMLTAGAAEYFWNQSD